MWWDSSHLQATRRGLRMKPTFLAPWSWIFQPPGLWKINFYCLSHSLCGGPRWLRHHSLSFCGVFCSFHAVLIITAWVVLKYVCNFFNNHPLKRWSWIPLPLDVAGCSDLLLASRIWWKWLCVTSETSHNSHHGFLLALSWDHLLRENPAALSWGHSRERSMWQGTEASCQQPCVWARKQVLQPQPRLQMTIAQLLS